MLKIAGLTMFIIFSVVIATAIFSAVKKWRLKCAIAGVPVPSSSCGSPRDLFWVWISIVMVAGLVFLWQLLVLLFSGPIVSGAAGAALSWAWGHLLLSISALVVLAALVYWRRATWLRWFGRGTVVVTTTPTSTVVTPVTVVKKTKVVVDGEITCSTAGSAILKAALVLGVLVGLLFFSGLPLGVFESSFSFPFWGSIGALIIVLVAMFLGSLTTENSRVASAGLFVLVLLIPVVIVVSMKDHSVPILISSFFHWITSLHVAEPGARMIPTAWLVLPTLFLLFVFSLLRRTDWVMLLVIASLLVFWPVWLMFFQWLVVVPFALFG